MSTDRDCLAFVYLSLPNSVADWGFWNSPFQIRFGFIYLHFFWFAINLEWARHTQKKTVSEQSIGFSCKMSFIIEIKAFALRFSACHDEIQMKITHSHTHKRTSKWHDHILAVKRQTAICFIFTNNTQYSNVMSHTFRWKKTKSFN